MSRRIFTKVITILIITILVGGSITLFYFYNEKKETTKKIDHYLIENGYQEKVKKKKTTFNIKKGKFGTTIVFNDEPENEYEIEFNDSDHIEITAFYKGEETTDKTKAKYIK